MDYDLVVIGSGPGGYVAALRAAALGMKTACVDKRSTWGGTCLNVGCIPSKTLLQSSEYVEKMQKHGSTYGIDGSSLTYDFSLMMEKKRGVIEGLAKGIDGLFKKNKVHTFSGNATFLDPHTIEVDGKQIRASRYLIATGSEPISLPFASFDEEKILSSTGALQLKKVPRSLVVVGAGVIGVELASVFRRLGTTVTVIEMLSQICPALDHEIGSAFLKILKKQGLLFHLQAKVLSCTESGLGISLSAEIGGKEEQFEADHVLVSAGRRPYTEGLGLEKIGLSLGPKGFILVNDAFQTAIPHIYAVGDVIEGVMLAHRASDEGIAVVEKMAGLDPLVHYAAIPNVIYTHPEVATVGLTESECASYGLDFLIGRCSLIGNPRARCSGETEGAVKIIGEKETGRILGVHLISAHASEMVGECALAIKQKMTLQELAASSHAHPTLSEAVKEAALDALGAAIHH